MTIIALSAPKQSGKSTLARHIQEELSTLLAHPSGTSPTQSLPRPAPQPPILSFAAPLKATITAFLRQVPLPHPPSHYLTHKEETIPFLNITCRRLMQTLGTEWAHNTISPALWSEILVARLPLHPLVIIDDLRFPQERLALEAYAAHSGRALLVVHINRVGHISPQGSQQDTHPSEQGLPVEMPDLAISNHQGNPTDFARDGWEEVHTRLSSSHPGWARQAIPGWATAWPSP